MSNNGFDIGDTLSISCIGCPRWFTWTVPSGWTHSVPSYHSTSCKKRHKRRISKIEVWRCPRPDKKLYTTLDSCRLAAAELCKSYNELFSEYRCECGGLHVGKKTYRVKTRIHE